MRCILGDLDNPNSSYILVVRGICEFSLDYFSNHTKRFPTWGLLLFPEKGQLLFTKERFESICSFKGIKTSSIHQVFFEDRAVMLSDKEILEYVRDNFPPYQEDSDPLTEVIMDGDHDYKDDCVDAAAWRASFSPTSSRVSAAAPKIISIVQKVDALRPYFTTDVREKSTILESDLDKEYLKRLKFRLFEELLEDDSLFKVQCTPRGFDIEVSVAVSVIPTSKESLEDGFWDALW